MLCNIQNILSFLWMTYIHIVLQKPPFSQSKISKASPQNILIFQNITVSL